MIVSEITGTWDLLSYVSGWQAQYKTKIGASFVDVTLEVLNLFWAGVTAWHLVGYIKDPPFNQTFI